MSVPLSSWEAAASGLVLALALMASVWAASVPLRDASLVDRFWGLGFVLLAVWYYLTGPAAGQAGPALLVVGLTSIWGLRLSGYIAWRNWGHGEDYRYRQMRARGGPRWAWTSLVTVFLLQAMIMWIVSLALLPAARVTAGRLHPIAVLGILCWGVGFYFEAAGDAQLARFRANPANRGLVLDRGVWRYTRHPNYFGDACVWWGLWCFSAAAGAWWTVVSPLLMTTLLLRVSGVALLERNLTETKPQYRDYVRRTSPFLPRRPRRG